MKFIEFIGASGDRHFINVECVAQVSEYKRAEPCGHGECMTVDKLLEGLESLIPKQHQQKQPEEYTGPVTIIMTAGIAGHPLHVRGTYEEISKVVKEACL